MLTEDDIKQKFLPFLKEFYRYRYEFRPESLHAELDNVSAGGLVADGMVSFRKQDGTPFVCTYEATSVDKSGEVKFSLNVRYFTWDCLAFGAMTATAGYAIAYAARLNWLKNLEWTGNAGFVLGMGVIGFLIWYFTMRNWRKYRYIYAIEQFKQYFAHEQWVALGEDVFPSPNDPYLLELKNQCVYNGFGLALVPESGEIRTLITPSRLGIYGKDRRMVQWVTRLQWYQAMSQNVSAFSRMRTVIPDEVRHFFNKLWGPVRYLLIDPAKKSLLKSRSGGKQNTGLGRFMQAHGVQKWIFALSLLVIVPLCYRVLTAREDRVEDVVQLPASNPEDQYGYLYEGETPRRRDPRGIPKQDPNPVSRPDKEENIPTINLSGDPDEDDIPTINLSGVEDEPKAATPAPSPVPYSTEPAQKIVGNPCTRFQNQKGWIIQDNAFSNKTFADQRIAALRKKGIQCDLIPRSCFGDALAQGYVVRLNSTQASEIAAQKLAGNLSQTLTRYGLLQGKLLVRRFN